MDNLTEKFTGLRVALLRAIWSAMNFIIILAGCIMALTFFFVVILRYGFDADLFAYEEWLMVVAFWMFFMASAVATHNNVHINADILGIFIKSQKVAWIRTIVVQAIEFIVLIYLTYLSYVMVAEEITSYPMWQTSIALKIPFLVPRLGIALGFLMMAVYTALYLYVLFKEGPSGLSDDEQAVV
ncbi:C4-dicarboxylate ABC transporter [Vibrio navarrensis]|jgi:TRAP-type C4-dicarboxylate transport system permease small subunit|uniref:TRAP transporter small permease n=1 Tax=Vibrio navarrensis TaxID=29495 RepID=UPI00192F561E|nr:TRAP transporter small permease subunit [Vibrio navarrensis]MBE3671323.1 C4-dicarboxylate ABC transporter [Vibrio navarrensis]